jgi:hypothetical protein
MASRTPTPAAEASLIHPPIQERLPHCAGGPGVAEDSWVCFVEAKYLADAAGSVTHAPLRNQLTRVIENLLCFQAGGTHPSRLHFALLTPQLFRDHPKVRLYGYKLHDYYDRDAILEDIESLRTSATLQGRLQLPRAATAPWRSTAPSVGHVRGGPQCCRARRLPGRGATNC